MVLALLLRPTGVGVLVAALMGLALLLLIGIVLFRLPKGRAIALLDLLVLFAGVALAESLHKGGIDNLTFVE